nr:cell wall-binding repeat-containing protein [Cellulomonas sp. JH27-2]
MAGASSESSTTGVPRPEASPAAPSSSSSPSTSPSPSPSGPPRAVTRAPQASATVLPASPGAAALAASRAVFASSPVVVVVGADDAAGQLTAASVAAGLGAPVLLTGTGVPDAAGEIARLGATSVVRVGDADVDGLGVGVVDVPVGADATRLEAATGALAVRPSPAEGTVALVGAGTVPLAALATLRAAGVATIACPSGDPRTTAASVAALADASPNAVVALGKGFGSAGLLAGRVASAKTGAQLPGGGQLIFPEGTGVRGKRYVALYGTPGSKALGVLGEQSVPKTMTRAASTAKKYRPLTSDTVVPMVEAIATIAAGSKGEDGDYSRERSVAELRPLVEAARAKGVAVVLDLQPGRADFRDQAKRYAPLLALPNVGLALDPEWRLTKKQKPLHQIGSVRIGEVNGVVDWLADFTAQRHLPQKMLVLHQFSTSMIAGRSKLDTTRDELAMVIHVDGQGSQPAKAGTWATIRKDAPDVHWGWKNFYDEDKPMLSPKKTYAVHPRPDLVSYQ